MKKKKEKRKRKGNYKRKWLIQIRTNSRGWTTVEYLGTKNGKIIVRLSDGQIIHRHFRQVKYGVARKVPSKNPVKRKSGKKYKTKKKRNRFNKSNNRNSRRTFKPKRKRKYNEFNIRITKSND